MTTPTLAPPPAPFNTVPDGWHEISEAEFAKSNYFSYAPARTEFRQFPIAWNGRTLYHGVFLLHYWDESGLALVNEYWDGKVRYFAFGCTHRMKEGGGRVTCEVCGFSHARPDSSD